MHLNGSEGLQCPERYGFQLFYLKCTDFEKVLVWNFLTTDLPVPTDKTTITDEVKAFFLWLVLLFKRKTIKNIGKRVFTASDQMNTWKLIKQQPFWDSTYKHLCTDCTNANMRRAPRTSTPAISTEMASLFERSAILALGLTQIIPVSIRMIFYFELNSYRNSHGFFLE